MLSSTLRLVDLHDSNHERHSGNTSVSVETRTGLGDGYWLNIACLLLEYLLELDYETNGQYITQNRCLKHLQILIPDLTAEDLSYTVNVLSTPSELFYKTHIENTHSKTASTKRTALLEKQSKLGHIRLSHSGRQSVTLSKQVDDILYSEHDAAKIISAIARNDFDRIPVIADSILLAIRGLTHEIRRTRESPALEGKLESFRNNRKHYEMAIRNIQATIMDCRNQFHRPEIRERFQVWAGQQDTEWDLMIINQPFTRILVALENLNRRLTDLLHDIAEGRIQSMGVVDFYKAALNLARNPPADEVLQSVFQHTAPVNVRVNLPSTRDFSLLLDNRRAESNPKHLIYDDTSDEPRESLLLQRFLSLFGQTLRNRLTEGPLSLGEAIQNGWHCYRKSEGNDQDFLPQLINMFVDTEQLQANLSVAVEPDSLNIELPDGRRLHGDNPVLITEQSVPQSSKPLTQLSKPLTQSSEER